MGFGLLKKLKYKNSEIITKFGREDRKNKNGDLKLKKQKGIILPWILSNICLYIYFYSTISKDTNDGSNLFPLARILCTY
jgi:hypothetical protein